MQLSQPRHSSILTGSDFPSLISNTLAGHVSTHSPLPSHLLLSTVTVYISSFSPPQNDHLLKILSPTGNLVHDPDHKTYFEKAFGKKKYSFLFAALSMKKADFFILTQEKRWSSMQHIFPKKIDALARFF
jgi:hypothetical protein